MGASQDFVAMATQDLFGKPKESAASLYEQSKKDSPAMAQFVEEATKELMFGADANKHSGKEVEAVVSGVDPKKIHENAKDLREAFAASAVEMGKQEESDDDLRNQFAASVMTPSKPAKVAENKTTEQLKETASAEADETLQKLLKGLR